MESMINKYIKWLNNRIPTPECFKCGGIVFDKPSPETISPIMMNRPTNKEWRKMKKTLNKWPK